MGTNGLRLCGVLLLAVLAFSFFHSYIDKDHLYFHQRPVGRSLSQNASVERDTCLCFYHGYFVPVFAVPQAQYAALAKPLGVFSENPLSLVVKDIFHPPLS